MENKLAVLFLPMCMTPFSRLLGAGFLPFTLNALGGFPKF